MQRLQILLSAGLVVWANVPAQAGIVNGGFDTGDLSGWTYSGPVSVEAVGGSPPAAMLHEDETVLDGTDLRQIFEVPAGSSPHLGRAHK